MINDWLKPSPSNGASHSYDSYSSLVQKYDCMLFLPSLFSNNKCSTLTTLEMKEKGIYDITSQKKKINLTKSQQRQEKKTLIQVDFPFQWNVNWSHTMCRFNLFGEKTKHRLLYCPMKGTELGSHFSCGQGAMYMLIVEKKYLFTNTQCGWEQRRKFCSATVVVINCRHK